MFQVYFFFPYVTWNKDIIVFGLLTIIIVQRVVNLQQFFSDKIGTFITTSKIASLSFLAIVQRLVQDISVSLNGKCQKQASNDLSVQVANPRI